MLGICRSIFQSTDCRSSLHICKHRRRTCHVPSKFHHHRAVCMCLSNFGMYNHHPTSRDCNGIYHIRMCHIVDLHTTAPDNVRKRSCRIRSICPKLFLRDSFVCHIRIRRIHTVHGHCNRSVLCYLDDSHGHVPIHCAHRGYIV